MELVSLFCFGAEDGEGVMDPELFDMFMSYVIEATSSKTKDFSPFPEHGIDATPVVRSFLLQQLLRTRWVMKESVVSIFGNIPLASVTCVVNTNAGFHFEQTLFSHIVYFRLFLVRKRFIRGHVSGGAYNRKQE